MRLLSRRLFLIPTLVLVSFTVIHTARTTFVLSQGTMSAPSVPCPVTMEIHSLILAEEQGDTTTRFILNATKQDGEQHELSDEYLDLNSGKVTFYAKADSEHERYRLIPNKTNITAERAVHERIIYDVTVETSEYPIAMEAEDPEGACSTGTTINEDGLSVTMGYNSSRPFDPVDPAHPSYPCSGDQEFMGLKGALLGTGSYTAQWTATLVGLDGEPLSLEGRNATFSVYDNDDTLISSLSFPSGQNAELPPESIVFTLPDVSPDASPLFGELVLLIDMRHMFRGCKRERVFVPIEIPGETPSPEPSPSPDPSPTPPPEEEDDPQYNLDLAITLDPDFIEARRKGEYFTPKYITPFYDILVLAREEFNKDHANWVAEGECAQPVSGEKKVSLLMVQGGNEWEFMSGIGLKLDEEKHPDGTCPQDDEWTTCYYKGEVMGWLRGWIGFVPMDLLVELVEEGWNLIARIEHEYDETSDAKAPCYPEQTNSPEENVELCVELWGPDGTTDPPKARHEIVTMRSVSSEFLPSDSVDKSEEKRTDGYQRIDPTAHYKLHFSHFADLKKHDDTEWEITTSGFGSTYFDEDIVASIPEVSECENKRLYYFYTNMGVTEEGAYTKSLSYAVIMSAFYFMPIGELAMHEFGHAFAGLNDIDNRPQMPEERNRWEVRSKPLPFLPFYGYAANIYYIAIEAMGVSPEHNTIMNSPGDGFLSSRFGLWEAAHIMSRILYDIPLDDNPSNETLGKLANKAFFKGLDVEHNIATYGDDDVECISNEECEIIAKKKSKEKGGSCITRGRDAVNNRCTFDYCVFDHDCPHDIDNPGRRCKWGDPDDRLEDIENNICEYTICTEDDHCKRNFLSRRCKWGDSDDPWGDAENNRCVPRWYP